MRGITNKPGKKKRDMLSQRLLSNQTEVQFLEKDYQFKPAGNPSHFALPPSLAIAERRQQNGRTQVRPRLINIMEIRATTPSKLC